MTNHQLEQRCLQVIGEATTRMQAAPNVKMRDKWRVIVEKWQVLLEKSQRATVEEPEG
jgi:hypothetical protein